MSITAMKQFYITLIAAAFYSFFASAQHFNPLQTSKQNNLQNLGEIQLAFDNWARHQDATAIKGNKPFYRWLWFNQMRQSEDETFSIARTYFEAGQMVSRKKNNGKDFVLNSWVPAGPVDLVPSTSSSPIHDLGRLNCIAFHPTDANTFWVGAPQGGIWKTTDGGQNWMPLGDDLPVMRISDIAVDPINPDVMYICLGDYGYMALMNIYTARATHYGLGVYKTTDGGQTWEPTGLTFDLLEDVESLMRRVFINPENTSELVAAGVSGIYKSQDAGETWTQASTEFVWGFEQGADNYQVVYATTFEYQNSICGIMKSIDFGESWEFLNTGIPENDTVIRIEVAVAPSDNNFVYAACSGYDDAFYAFYRSVDGGESWQMTADSSQRNIFGQFNGDHTNKLAQASYDLWVMVDEYNPEAVYTGAMNIWGSKDGGENWDICSLGLDWFGESIHFDHHFVKKSPLDNKTYFCGDGGLFRTDSLVIGNSHLVDSCFNGNYLYPECYQFETQWENLSSGLVITEFYRLGLSYNSPGFVIAGSQDNCVFYKNNTDDWINLTQGDGMECMLHPDDPEILYASNQFGVMYKSTNGGQNMSVNPITIPMLAAEGFGVWVTPFQMDQDEPQTLYAGFRNVWKSTSSGASWAKISNFSNMPGQTLPQPIWDMALCPTNPDVIYVSKQPYPAAFLGLQGELWKTIDGGENWEEITASAFFNSANYINDIAITENPDKAYVALSGFSSTRKVFMTEDGGQSWENISGSLPNIPITTIVHQMSSDMNDLYIGCDLGVFYRNDEMDDWELFSDNLPNVIVNELEIDYTDSKLYAATYGRGIWFADLMNPITGMVEGDKGLRNLEITLLPNPCSDAFSVSIAGGSIQVLVIQLIDIIGNVKISDEISYLAANDRLSYSISELPAGLYFVKVSTGGQSKVCRLIKK